MTNVAVACWAIENLPGGQGGTEIDNIPAMSRHISFDTVMASAVNAMPHHPVKIFVAPEYLFTERDAGAAAGSPDMVPASRSQKHAIYGRLRLISARYPDIYIIAGTIAYEKRSAGGLGKKHSYNVCPVLMGGEIIRTIYKSQDDGMLETEGVFGVKENGDSRSPIFAAGGINVGVDICLDYVGTPGSINGRLAQLIESNQGLSYPDIHVQISGTNSALPSRAQARANGAYVHCDLGKGAAAYRILSRAGLNATHSAVAGNAITQSVGSLKIFDLTL